MYNDQLYDNDERVGRNFGLLSENKRQVVNIISVPKTQCMLIVTDCVFNILRCICRCYLCIFCVIYFFTYMMHSCKRIAIDILLLIINADVGYRIYALCSVIIYTILYIILHLHLCHYFMSFLNQRY